jgi:hypothetical protein
MPHDLAHTPLHALHRELGARRVAFAGDEMPLASPRGILAEHRRCRDSGALFDDSHMGQVRLLGPDAPAALETLVPADVLGLGVDQQRYALFTNASAGVLDDLMGVRREDDVLLIVNASRKEADTAHLRARIGTRCRIEPQPDQALLALQGPKAVQALAALQPEMATLAFMSGASIQRVGRVGLERVQVRPGTVVQDARPWSPPGPRHQRHDRTHRGRADRHGLPGRPPRPGTPRGARRGPRHPPTHAPGEVAVHAPPVCARLTARAMAHGSRAARLDPRPRTSTPCLPTGASNDHQIHPGTRMDQHRRP